MNVRILCFLLLCAPGLLPLDAAVTRPPDLQWTEVEGVWIPVPPAEHPRLFLRARDLDDLKRRTTHPVLAPVWEKLQAAGEKQPALGFETAALKYLLSRDAELGRRTAAGALKLLQDARFNLKTQDVTRPIGRLMVTGSVVYDWCYPVLSPDQKQAFLAELLRLAKILECGYPPRPGEAVTGHYSEWMLMRDLLSAGLAVYDEFPEMYRLAATRFFKGFVPVRNWWYSGHAFHQGSSYAETRFSSDLYPLWVFERLGAGNVYNPAPQFVPYQWIYMRRPDGQLLRSGDGQSRPPKLRSLLTASYYGDGYVLSDYLKDPGIDPASSLFEFLWRDPDLQPKPISDLPLSYYMDSPYGWMVARTGWGEDSVIAEMKVNVYNFGNHQHLDAGSFQIYYKGPLAIDSGIYEGTTGGYGSAHDINYNKRTIAHNSLLVYDPAEKIVASGARVIKNDGGQRHPNQWREPRSLEDMLARYRTAEVLGQGFGPDRDKPAYTYLKGDLTQAYGPKVREVKRSFVFLNLENAEVPAALVVFDKVVSSEAAFKKYWLLHSMEQPKTEDSAVTLSLSQRGWRGKLVNYVLSPDEPEIASVGGPGKEFWVFGENFPNQPRRNTADFEVGEWRVEISPRRAAETDHFLNVMEVMDAGSTPVAASRLTGKGVAGVQLLDRVVLFQTDGGRAERPVSFSVKGDRILRCLVADLASGTWQIRRDGEIVKPAVRVSSESGTLYFEGPGGNYELRR